MTEDLNNKLTAKFPKLFTGFQRPNGEGYYPFWFECGDGWYTLIEELAKDIQYHVDHQNESYTYKVERGEAKEEDRPDYQVRAVQVKQKFGGLRFYINRGCEYIDGMIAFAESMSYKICEHCGNAGKTGGDGWIYTFCDPCRELDRKRREEYNARIEADIAKYRAEQVTKEQQNG